MNAGEKVRFKATAPPSERLNIPHDALGAVMCRYRVLRGATALHRLDVRFGPHLVVWGAPESLFEKAEDETWPS